MKTNTLITLLLLTLISCQNNTKKTDSDHSMNADSSGMNMNRDTAMNGGPMMQAMDNMMKDMHQVQMTGNVDYDFALMMKSHHQGAVDMAQAELESGKDEPLKQMAQKIIDEQKAEINELESFLNSHKSPQKNYDPTKKDAGFSKVMAENMTMMMDMPKMGEGSSIDKQFIQMMIPHHESAVHMAEGFIKYGQDQGLISMANKMINDQKKEIADLKKWDESYK